MNSPAKIILRGRVCAAGLLALACHVSGCQTAFRTVDARFMAHREEHRRAQVLPVWFEGAGNVDRTFTTNDLQEQSRQASENLSALFPPEQSKVLPVEKAKATVELSFLPEQLDFLPVLINEHAA
jgi:hypothetical protein